MSDKLPALRLDFTSRLPSMIDQNLEPASLLASIERTPHLAQHYAKLSAQVRTHLSHGRYLEPQDFAPAARILLTTRCGGQSVAPYDSFNLAHHVGDDLKQVGANRQLLLQDLGCQHVCFMDQTHSKRIGIITTSSAAHAHDPALGQSQVQTQTQVQAHFNTQAQAHFNTPDQANFNSQSQAQAQSNILTSDQNLASSSALESVEKPDWEFMSINEPVVSGLNCDGLVTDEPGVALAVMTADCLPLLLCEPEARVVGAIHCGWKGLQQGIVQNAIQAMAHLGANPAKVHAVMGAAIGPQSFEIGAEVKAAFEHMSLPAHQEQIHASQQDLSWAQACFIAEQDEQGQVVQDKFLLNLYQLCSDLLQASGVLECNISGGEFDTRMQSEIFYSYRVSKVTGRLASVVCLNADK